VGLTAESVIITVTVDLLKKALRHMVAFFAKKAKQKIFPAKR